MTNFFFSQFAFYLAIALVLFVPGYFLSLAVFGKKQPFAAFEKLAISFGTSIIITDFLMIAIGKFKIPITRISIIISILLFSTICGLIFYFQNRKKTFSEKSSIKTRFSQRQLLTIFAIIFLTIFIKTAYLKDAVLPASTDLGHHMYWTKTIALTGQLPQYEEADVTKDFTISQPEPIADFIIGEHLVFAAIGLISGLDYISYFPVLVLFLVHMMGIFAIFSLAILLFKDFENGNNISIATLFLIGPVYALSSPQAKFVSGGVIGNTIGNLLIPLAIYFFVRALSEKSSRFFALAVFTLLGMAYTHHLSTFVFIFVFIFSALFFAIFNHKNIIPHFRDWAKMIFSKQVLSVLFLGIIFVFLFYTPTYLNKSAVDTAVGAPSKATRMGLTPSQLKFAAGEARMALAVIGIAILLFMKKRSSYGSAFLFGWMISITIMSLRPSWLFIDIPSNRISSYIGFPVAIFAAFAIVEIFSLVRTSSGQYLRSSILLSTFMIIFSFIAINGFYDNSQSLNLDSNPKSVLQTNAASKYLAENSNDSDMILKDHNYLAADSWIKLYFMRGYNYPLSRGFFKRYADPTKPREQCTNLMISTPNSEAAKKCFEGTKTDFLMVDPKMDSVQFQKSKEFWQVYSAEDIAIFYKTK